MKATFKLALIGLSVLILAKYTVAQDCEAFYPMKEGAYVEMKSYDEKNKLTGTVKNTVIKKEVMGNNVTAVVDVKSYDDKDKLTFTNQIEMSCKDGVFYIDMKNFMDPQSTESMKDMQVSMQSENLEIPSNMQPGLMLKDGSLTMSIETGAMKMAGLTIRIINRKVEAIENVTCPAGSYSCYKISQDIETKTMFKNTTKSVTWYAKDVGAVRSETYNSKGKLMGYSVLTDYKY
jgi:hypothetical protein